MLYGIHTAQDETFRASQQKKYEAKATSNRGIDSMTPAEAEKAGYGLPGHWPSALAAEAAERDAEAQRKQADRDALTKQGIVITAEEQAAIARKYRLG